jgi:hypothetical protein
MRLTKERSYRGQEYSKTFAALEGLVEGGLGFQGHIINFAS